MRVLLYSATERHYVVQIMMMTATTTIMMITVARVYCFNKVV